MSDFNLPDINELYVDVLDELKARDIDVAQLFLNAPTNPVTGMIRYVRASNKFQEYDGATWLDKVISLTGGGLGSTTAAGGRTSLGLGTIATQDANNVNITGGALGGNGAGLTNLNAANIASGIIALARLANITNAEIAAAAAIAWTKISKTGSSIADLATRSAADLNSGMLPLARLGSNSPTAVKFLRGDNTWADVSMVVAIWALVGDIVGLTKDFTLSPAIGTIAKTVIMPEHFPPSELDGGSYWDIINTTTVRYTRISTAAGTMPVRAKVIEYYIP